MTGISLFQGVQVAVAKVSLASLDSSNSEKVMGEAVEVMAQGSILEAGL